MHGAALAGALARMSGRDRDVLLLFALADLGYAEIAQALDMPVGTVRSKLHRARRRLQVSLGPQVRSALNLDSRLSTRPATEVSR